MRAIHFLLAIILIFNSISAQDSTNIEYDYEAKSDDWRFIISPYFWFAGQSTDVGGEKIRQSFNDLASLTNFGFQLSAGVLYKKWILSFDGTYANLGSNQEDLLLTLDLDIKQYMADIKLGYLVYSNISKEDGGVVRGWALEVNAGAKYWQNDITVDYKIQIGNLEPFGQTIK